MAQALQQEILQAFPQLSAQILSEDSYYRDQADLPLQQREQVNYDHPDALEHELLLQHLRTLKSDTPVAAPTYDYTEHTRSPQTQPLEPTGILIVEGILLLSSSELRQEFDLSLFVDTPLEVCLQRRMERDVRERGRSEESVQQQFDSTVKPMFHAHIEPTREYAHLILSGEDAVVDMSRRVCEELKLNGHL